MSDQIFRNHTPLGAVSKKEMYFVGDFSPVVSGSETGLVEWAPDELRVETEDIVTVKYVDEVESVVSEQDEVKSVVSKQDEVTKSVVSKQDEVRKLVVSKQDEVKSVVSKRRFFGQLFRTYTKK